MKGPSHRSHTGRRGSGFSQGELANLRDFLQENLPLGKDEWEKLSRWHQSTYPAQRRNADSLRRKFSAVCRTTVPTGAPTIPDDVLKTKQIE